MMIRERFSRTPYQAHGGRIEAQSHIGEGTQMSLHLQLAAENLGAHAIRTSEQDHA